MEGDKISQMWRLWLFWSCKRNNTDLGSIPCLLMPWLLKSSEHRQAKYWPCRTDNMCCEGKFHLLGSSLIHDTAENMNTSFVILKTIQSVKISIISQKRRTQCNMIKTTMGHWREDLYGRYLSSCELSDKLWHIPPSYRWTYTSVMYRVSKIAIPEFEYCIFLDASSLCWAKNLTISRYGAIDDVTNTKIIVFDLCVTY